MFNKKIFGIGLAVGAFFTFLIVLAVYILYTPPPRYELPALAENTGEEAGVSVYDFAFPDEVARFLSPRPWYFREPGTVWTQEDSAEFWIDPQGLAVEFLTRGNRRKLDEIFKRVP
jgi:hypothetical protein